MMKCEELQFELPLIADDVLTDQERCGIETHLAHCPLCRQKAADFQKLRTALREMPRGQIPRSMLDSIRASISGAMPLRGTTPAFNLIEGRRWADAWLMPSAIAGLCTVVFGFALLTAMLSANVRPYRASEFTATKSPAVYLASVDGEAMLTPSNYARSRLAVAGESPSLNPQGALIALTKSLVRGEMKDDEVVVVADVFGNGLAQIAEVVEPSHDRRAVAELQRALAADPAYAPFVPAAMDRRSDSVRVVLKIQSVDVSTRLKENN